MREASFFSIVAPLGLTCGVPIVLLIVGMVAGRLITRRHLRRLERREMATRLSVTDLRSVPPGLEAGGALLVIGSVVIAADVLMSTLAQLRKVIGGEVHSFEPLMARARREALCRMVDDATRIDAVAVVNVRLETSNIASMRRKRKGATVEVIAFGTALLPAGVSSDRLDVSLPCPRCGYQLTGIGAVGCPECGWGRPVQATE